MKMWVFFFLWSVSSFALGTSNWTTLWPYVNGIPIVNLCVEGESLKSIEPLKLCVSHTELQKACASGEICRTLQQNESPQAGEIIRTEVRCNRYENESAEFARSRVVKKCVKFQGESDISYGQCLEWKMQKEVIPLEYRVGIYRNQGDRGLEYSHSIEYSILECF